jgi:two-component system cell cycle response regulator DivK
MSKPGSIHVLIVDDDLVNLELLQAVLEGEGFRVSAASDAISALEIARSRQPDIVLMDVQLPETDGLEATRRLKADAKTAGIPVVAVTAHVRSDDQQRCLEVGCVRHVAKPIDTRQLPRLIHEVLEGRTEVHR